jgi:hypothetical protein
MQSIEMNPSSFNMDDPFTGNNPTDNLYLQGDTERFAEWERSLVPPTTTFEELAVIMSIDGAISTAPVTGQNSHTDSDTD